MSDITLETLIQELKERIGLLKFKPNPPGCIGFSYYYYDDSETYQKWLATTKRFISIKYPNDKDVNEFESISKETLQNGAEIRWSNSGRLRLLRFFNAKI